MEPTEILNWICLELTRMFTEYRNVLKYLYLSTATYLIFLRYKRLHTPYSNDNCPSNYVSLRTVPTHSVLSHFYTWITQFSLTLLSHILNMLFMWQSHQISQLFNLILCTGIVPPQYAFYSFWNSVNVIPKWHIQTIFSLQYHAVSTALYKMCISFDPTRSKVCYQSTCNDLTELAYTAAAWFLFLGKLCSLSRKNSHFIINTNYIITFPNNGSLFNRKWHTILVR